jgi:hypothetical protein
MFRLMFEVLMAVTAEDALIWNVPPCSLVEIY